MLCTPYPLILFYVPVSVRYVYVCMYMLLDAKNVPMGWKVSIYLSLVVEIGVRWSGKGTCFDLDPGLLGAGGGGVGDSRRVGEGWTTCRNTVTMDTVTITLETDERTCVFSFQFIINWRKHFHTEWYVNIFMKQNHDFPVGRPTLKWPT